MGLLPDFLSNNITSLTKKDLEGISSTIRQYAFANKSKLTTVELPDNVDTLLQSAFIQCDALTSLKFGKNLIKEIQLASIPNKATEINMDEINEYSELSSAMFTATPWYKSFPSESMICVGNDKILFANTITTPSNGFVIPDTVINLAGNSCAKYGNDTNFTSFTIPDHIKIVQGSVFASQPLQKIIISASVEKITGTITVDATTTTLVFKHPAGAYIELPTPGSGAGLAYNKNSRAISVYTDNEYVKNYGWSTDNATVTFYPLSQAPM